MLLTKGRWRRAVPRELFEKFPLARLHNRPLGIIGMVAEGVESVHQLQVLSDLGCTKAQGYLISHPVPADAMRSTVAALERLGQFPGLRPAPSNFPTRQP